MNPVGQESGNEDVSAGRDIPWLQDVDEDNDDHSDNWLVAFDAVYRDVVIVDANGVWADSYNLTLNSLEEPPSYNTLRQMLIDVATSAIDSTDDFVSVPANATSEINVLANDAGTSRLTITEVTQPEFGNAEIFTAEYPAHLDPTHWPTTELLISEIVPGEYLEFYNTSYTESFALGTASQVLVSGDFNMDIASLSSETIAPRSYQQTVWPEGLEMSWDSGELILFHDRELGFESGANIDDFVAWGEIIESSRIDLARQFRQWEGEPDGILDLNAIQRIPGTIGNEPHSYDNHRPSTPGNAINDAVETLQVIRYTPPESFSGEVELTYTVVDDSGSTDTASVRIQVADGASPWQNPADNLDVNNDGFVTAADALSIINVLNAGIAGDLPTQIVTPFAPVPFVDCNGNNSVEPLDVFLIFKHLNEAAASSEPPSTEPPLDQGETESEGSIVTDSNQVVVDASFWASYAQAQTMPIEHSAADEEE